ncbi:MAG: hypothetical protein AVDCRST_MAG52-565, partial [uncultured Blastococcus sp.]
AVCCCTRPDRGPSGAGLPARRARPPHRSRPVVLGGLPDAGPPRPGHDRDRAALDLHGLARRVPAQDAGLHLGRLVALPVAARRPGAPAPAQFRGHRRRRRPGGVPHLHRLRRRPPGAAAHAVWDRRVPRRRPDRHRQPPHQRPGHHQLEPQPRAALPGDGDHAGRRHPRLVALRRARPGPRPRLARAVAVLRRERALPQPAPGVRRPVAGGLRRRPDDGGAAAAGLRRLAGPVPGDVHAARALVGAPCVADLRRPALPRPRPPDRRPALDRHHHRRGLPGLPRGDVAGAGRHGLPALGAAAGAPRRRGPRRPRRHLPGARLGGWPGRGRRRLRGRLRPGIPRPAAALELVVGAAGRGGLRRALGSGGAAGPRPVADRRRPGGRGTHRTRL